MIENSLRVLEYYRLLNILSDYAASPLGRSDCLSLKPLKEFDFIDAEQRLVSEMKELLLIKGFISLSDLKDLRSVLKKAGKSGSYLDPKEILSFHDLLVISRKVKKWVHEARHLCPSLTTITDNIPECIELIKEIEKKITKDGDISDSASSLLCSLRSQRAAIRSSIDKKLRDLLNSPLFSNKSIISVRDGRYVVSVRSSDKSSIKGIVHGYSSSHSTSFIEPLAVMENNNLLVELTSKEREEERRILIELTDFINDFSPDINSCLEIMGRIDGIFARAEYSRAINGISPILTNDKTIYLKNALNPILLSVNSKTKGGRKKENAERVIPIEVKIDAENNILIISGPNRGGKTVALKTIGLLALMVQTGIHIPVQEGSKICVLGNVLAEIGDEQDILAGLSTFSARLEHLKEIVNTASEDSLVVLDELGVGTDPDEGAALAMAILDYLSEKDSLTVISTHYQRVKNYGLLKKNARNAAVEFDRDRKIPTFRLISGVPGVSHGIEIARDLGIKHGIIERAMNYLDKDKGKPDLMMEELSRMMDDIKKEKKNIGFLKQEYETLLKDLEEKQERFDEQIKKVIIEKEHGAEKIFSLAKREFGKAIASLKERGSSGQFEATQRYTMAKRNMAEALSMLTENRLEKYTPVTIGECVFHKQSKRRGYVIGIDESSSKIRVLMGNMKINVDSSELVKDKTTLGEQKNHERKHKQWSVSKTHVTEKELNIVGHTVDEAIPLVDNLIDRALVNGYSTVKIIHGMGSGTLRRVVREYLKENSCVKDFAPGGKEGVNDGFTIVEL